MPEIPKTYEPGKIEKKWYSFWLEQGYFTPEIDPEKKPFVIIMPPPNVTGELHLGHALTTTLEDIMARWHRMRGEPTLWLPGTDHAGIATQVVVEQELAKQGLGKNDTSREKFLEVAWDWVNRSREAINQQHQMLGASCDWTRERFTLDQGPSRAVRTAFVKLYDRGLIYRGERMINWCPRCQTALSDLEVEHRDMAGHLYYIRYPLARNDGFVTVATTRPETFFGDTAVAVNPEDKRYKNLVTEEVVLPIINKKIPIITDNAVDSSFGTGALKITPAHDPTDFEIAQRHNLPLVNIMNPDATMNENAGPYKNWERFACREKVIAELRDKGLLEKIEPYFHSVGHCSRCLTMIEPKVSLQWFVNTQPLAKAAIETVKKGSITIIPERFNKVYFDWMENIRDWCISRQLWWGQRIPVWYCQGCGKLIVSVEEPLTCDYCDSKRIVQDRDVLDTWFSSALWTHSTLGWPEDTDDLRYFYPSSVMETGYDIIFFWVARMVMMGLENMGEVPFRTIYLHGLVRDENGEKMSKLRGNVINPTEAIKEYGIDALRFALTVDNPPGTDVNLSEGKLESGRNFVNKLWNASRFIFQAVDEAFPQGQALKDVIASEAKQTQGPLPMEDRWINSRLNRLIDNVNKLIDEFQFGEAEHQIYDFFWREFCDWYIEIAKLRLRERSTPSPLPFLASTLEISLRLLHPFMPFITEELWQSLLRAKRGNLMLCSLQNDSEKMPSSIMIAPYPVADDKAIDSEAEWVMDSIIEAIRSIRNARAKYKVEPSRWVEAQIYADDLLPHITSQAKIIETLGHARPLAILPRDKRRIGQEALAMVLKESEVVLPLGSMIDLAKEKQNLAQEIEITQTRVEESEARLGDSVFLTKAPEHVVEKERQRLKMLRDKLKRLDQELSQLAYPSMGED